jgi:hypothetical protein
VRHAEHVLHEVVTLGDELHVAVLDAVVDHLHEVARRAGADVRDAWAVVDLGGNLLQDRRDLLVGARFAAGHQRRAVEGAFFTTRDAHADEAEALGLELPVAPFGVVGMRVAGVEDHVPGFEERQERGDRVVDGLAGFDEQQHLARARERGHGFLGRFGADHLVAGFAARERGCRLVVGAVVDRDRKAVARDVEREVLAHHGEAGDADLRVGCHALAA